MRTIRMWAAAATALVSFALSGCYQSALKETPPVRFTQDQLGKPLENLLGDPKEGVEIDSQVEVSPASLEQAAPEARSG